MLKESVADELCAQGRSPALGESAAFAAAACAALESVRDTFDLLEERLGLFTAMLDLPERQFDVLVLQHVLGYDTTATGHIMGITAATVRSHNRLAKRKLATLFGIDQDEK